MTVVPIPTSRITDWRTFHDVFAETLGFPGYYGRNGNAWIDCMTYVDDPDAGMTRITVGAGDVLTLQLGKVADFAARCPEQYAALIECVAFVNWRRLDIGERSILALAFHKTRARVSRAPQPSDARPDTA
jgi:hypothetical protein